MALLSVGPIGRVSGKVGGIEVAQVGGRSVLKQAKLRQSSSTSRRIVAQSLQAAAVRAWRNMTDTGRLRWEISARSRLVTDRFGVSRALNGFQLFMSMPRGLSLFGGYYFLLRPPTIVYPEPWVAVVTASHPSTMTLFVNPGVGYASWVVQLWISRFRPVAGDAKPSTWISIGHAGVLFFSKSVCRMRLLRIHCFRMTSVLWW